jgi:hypothetical protein
MNKGAVCIEVFLWVVVISNIYTNYFHFADIKPFALHRNDENKYLCPVRAYLWWLNLRGEGDGPLFLLDKQGTLIRGQRMSYSSFKTRLQDELRQIGLARWRLYGTHSFRRGGCQYYLFVQMKTYKDVFAFGGWSNIKDAMRYMVGSNDILDQPRHNMSRPLKTGVCRDCRCKYLM